MRDYSNATDDKDVVYRQFFEKMQREYLRSLVSEEIIEEHKSQPLGQHSEPLERLLLFFRRSTQKGKYAIKRDAAYGSFRIITLPGHREEPVAVDADTEYRTPEEAYHEVFMRRIRELLDSD